MNLFLDADPDVRQALLDSLGVAACIVEPGGDRFTVVAMNDLCREYYGLPSQVRHVAIDPESLSRASGIPAALLEPIAQRMRSNYVRCIEARAPVQTENQTPQADGSERWSRNIISPVLRGDQVVCLLVVIADITEMIEAQKEIEANLIRLIGQHVRMCRGCQRIEDGTGNWLLLEEFMAARGGLKTSHGMCPDCRASLRT